MPGQRRRLVADALLEVAVRAQHERVVVADLGPEPGPQPAFGDAHADAVGEALAERSGGDLDACGVVHLRVARRPAAPLPERADVVERQAVASEVEHRVQEDRRVAAAEDEAVAVGPVGRQRIVTHDLCEQHVSQRSQRHRGAAVAGARLARRIHGQAPDDVDAKLLQVVCHRPSLSAAALSLPGWGPNPNLLRSVGPLPHAGRAPTLRAGFLRYRFPACREDAIARRAARRTP